VFEGVVHGDSELMIDGALKGDIHVSRLIVGENAHIEGKIRCGVVEVRGRVLGNIEAQSVKLYETAVVEGDIIHGQLSIDVGAFFQGRCQQLRAEQPAAQAAAPAPQPAPVSAAPSPISYAQMGEAAAPAAAAQVIDFDQNHRN
jgi:cytoskeletal protein CcmA (bactofilin family)